ncbi:hypothetical protein BaRGS_00015575 [Batillaria attramentaria]|uniref:Uncharacterized protein n=1 Tax=Batillaria attramentaria TaxID=370345 RepID=A0ABD0L141_9CAEN
MPEPVCSDLPVFTMAPPGTDVSQVQEWNEPRVRNLPGMVLPSAYCLDLLWWSYRRVCKKLITTSVGTKTALLRRVKDFSECTVAAA